MKWFLAAKRPPALILDECVITAPFAPNKLRPCPYLKLSGSPCQHKVTRIPQGTEEAYRNKKIFVNL